MKRLLLFIGLCLVVTPVLDLAGCEGEGHEADEAEDDDNDDSGADGDSDTDIDMDVDGDGDGDGDADGDTDDTDGESCRFIDIVIVVDPSTSMREELEAFRQDVFPAFAQKLTEVAEDLDDFRIATLDSCPNQADFHTRGKGGECNFESGERWINSTSPTINQEFECVGDIFVEDIEAACDTQNDGDEMPLATAASSLEPPWVENENQGFMRDEAILVLIPMTDEDEENVDNLSAQQYFDRLTALKDGKVQNMVMLGIGGSRTQNCPSLYGDVMDAAVLLKEVTDMFIAAERGIFWDLCDGQPLEDGLDAAIAIIKEACDDIDIE